MKSGAKILPPQKKTKKNEQTKKKTHNATGLSTSSYFLHSVTVTMTTVWWLVLPLYSLSFFTPLHSYLQYLCLKEPHDRSNSTFPFATLCPLLFIPNSPIMKACSLKDKIQKTKRKEKERNQGVNRLQERQRFHGLEMQHQSVCVRVFFPLTKNETEQGSLQYQRPLSPVICWEHREWSLMLFCYQPSSVSLQMNCWYRLMSYSLSSPSPNPPLGF